MIVRQIPPAELAEYLSQPEPARLFQEGVASMGHRITVADVTHLLHSGHMQLWASDDGSGSVLSEVVTFPQCKVLRLFGLAGQNLQRLATLLPAIKAWGAEQGCVEVEAYETRPGLEMVFPAFKRTGVCLVMPIGEAA
jgi:hypothetical protein